jgi:hypothetical protein
VKGLEKDVENAILFVKSAKVYMVIENFMAIILQAGRLISRRIS